MDLFLVGKIIFFTVLCVIILYMCFADFFIKEDKYEDKRPLINPDYYVGKKFKTNRQGYISVTAFKNNNFEVAWINLNSFCTYNTESLLDLCTEEITQEEWNIEVNKIIETINNLK